MTFVELMITRTGLLTGLGLVYVVARWIAPKPEPPKDEWQEWKNL